MANWRSSTRMQDQKSRPGGCRRDSVWRALSGRPRWPQTPTAPAAPSLWHALAGAWRLVLGSRVPLGRAPRQARHQHCWAQAAAAGSPGAPAAEDAHWPAWEMGGSRAAGSWLGRAGSVRARWASPSGEPPSANVAAQTISDRAEEGTQDAAEQKAREADSGSAQRTGGMAMVPLVEVLSCAAGSWMDGSVSGVGTPGAKTCDGADGPKALPPVAAPISGSVPGRTAEATPAGPGSGSGGGTIRGCASIGPPEIGSAGATVGAAAGAAPPEASSEGNAWGGRPALPSGVALGVAGCEPPSLPSFSAFMLPVPVCQQADTVTLLVIGFSSWEKPWRFDATARECMALCLCLCMIKTVTTP
jgi:hypothetical protein